MPVSWRKGDPPQAWWFHVMRIGSLVIGLLGLVIGGDVGTALLYIGVAGMVSSLVGLLVVRHQKRNRHTTT